MQPRAVLPRESVMITRRCTQRTFLLRPDDETNQTYLYVLGLAAQRARVDLIHAVTVTNHEHVVCFDRHGTRVEFYQYLHELVARATNALRGRSESFWSSEQTSVVKLVEEDDVVAKVVYAATNPVTAGLVERVHHWPGVNTLRALLAKEPIVVKRPRHFFSEDMPAEVTLTFAIPSELGDADEILARIRAQVAAVEEAEAAKRAETGDRVLGRRAVMEQSWRAQPQTREEPGGLRPQVACRSRWRRTEAQQRNREFLDAYIGARSRWRAGDAAVFPAGTYWLRRYAGVTVASGPPIRDPVVA